MKNEIKCILIALCWMIFSFALWMSGYYHKTILMPIFYTFATYMVIMKTFEIIKRKE